MIDKDYAPKGYEAVDAAQSNGADAKRPGTWVTVISEYNGFVSTRDVGPFDTTIYMDREIAEVPWLPGDKGPDHPAISEEMAKLGKEWRY